MADHPFTVVGYAIIDYAPDNWIQYEHYCERVWAEDSIKAAEVAAAQVIAQETTETVTKIDPWTCAVLPGHHENLPFGG